MAVNAIRRVLVAPLIVINFGLYLSVAAISGWALNIAIDYGWQGIISQPLLYTLLAHACISFTIH